MAGGLIPKDFISKAEDIAEEVSNLHHILRILKLAENHVVTIISAANLTICIANSRLCLNGLFFEYKPLFISISSHK